MPNHVLLDRDAATTLLARQGFNRLDIECILDLSGPKRIAEDEVWPMELIERLAARAYWLGENELPQRMPAAA